MNRPTLCFLAFLACTAGLAAEPDSAAPPVAVDVEVYRAPTLKDYRPASYPAGALLDFHEGWVIVNLMVDPDGKPYEVGVVDSLGGKPFEEAAIRAMERSSFEPAKEGGKAIHSGYTVKLKFAIHDLGKGASTNFVLGYGKLLKAIEAGDQDAADKALVLLKPLNLYEDAYRNLVLFQYHRKWGTESEQLIDLRAAVAGESNEKYLQRGQFGAALESLLRLEVRRNDFGAALETWRSLQTVAKPEQKTRWEPVIAQILEVQASNTTVRMDAGIERGTSWFGRLFRRRFQVVVLSGRVADIKVRCEKTYLLFHYEPDVDYSVNAREGQCTLELVGDHGTQFALIQS